MVNHRNTPEPITPHSKMKHLVEGLRDSEPPLATYRLYRLMPNGVKVYVGEFPAPEVTYKKQNGWRSPLP